MQAATQRGSSLPAQILPARTHLQNSLAIRHTCPNESWQNGEDIHASCQVAQMISAVFSCFNFFASTRKDALHCVVLVEMESWLPVQNPANTEV